MIQAELLTELDERLFKQKLNDVRYGFQEKFNGHRRLICKENGTIRVFNRVGEESGSLPPRLKYAFLSHPLPSFVIDGELVGGVYHVFDALILGTETMVHDTYEYREARLHTEFDGYQTSLIVPVYTARTTEEKIQLWGKVDAEHGEGLVAKNMTKGYKQGRAEQHFKLKFWKTADAVVIGPSPEGKDSVEIGMYDARGRLQRISGCSLRGKYNPRPGQVVEVRFLYATKERNIVQITLLSVRNDKRAADCKLSQLDQYVNKNWVKA